MTINIPVTEKGQHEISYPKMCGTSRSSRHPKWPVAISMVLSLEGACLLCVPKLCIACSIFRGNTNRGLDLETCGAGMAPVSGAVLLADTGFEGGNRKGETAVTRLSQT